MSKNNLSVIKALCSEQGRYQFKVFFSKHSGNAYNGFVYPIKDHLIFDYTLFILVSGKLVPYTNQDGDSVSHDIDSVIKNLLSEYNAYYGITMLLPDLALGQGYGYQPPRYQLPLSSVIPFLNAFNKVFEGCDIQELFYWITKDEVVQQTAISNKEAL